MGKFIIKIIDPQDNKDYFMEWSTIVDAPVTWGMSLEEFRQYTKGEYGRQGLNDLQERLDRVALKGSSGHPPYDDMKDVIKNNHAGENESEIDEEGLLNRYCRNHIE